MIVIYQIDGYIVYDVPDDWLLHFLRFWNWNTSWIHKGYFSVCFQEDMFLTGGLICAYVKF